MNICDQIWGASLIARITKYVLIGLKVLQIYVLALDTMANTAAIYEGSMAA